MGGAYSREDLIARYRIATFEESAGAVLTRHASRFIDCYRSVDVPHSRSGGIGRCQACCVAERLPAEMVEGGRGVPDLSAVFQGFQRRWHRRLGRNHLAA